MPLSNCPSCSAPIPRWLVDHETGDEWYGCRPGYCERLAEEADEAARRLERETVEESDRAEFAEEWWAESRRVVEQEIAEGVL